VMGLEEIPGLSTIAAAMPWRCPGVVYLLRDAAEVSSPPPLPLVRAKAQILWIGQRRHCGRHSLLGGAI
jgi:hypothetical protein